MEEPKLSLNQCVNSLLHCLLGCVAVWQGLDVHLLDVLNENATELLLEELVW